MKILKNDVIYKQKKQLQQRKSIYRALCICIEHALTAWICLKASRLKLHNLHFVLHLRDRNMIER